MLSKLRINAQFQHYVKCSFPTPFTHSIGSGTLTHRYPDETQQSSFGTFAPVVSCSSRASRLQLPISSFLHSTVRHFQNKPSSYPRRPARQAVDVDTEVNDETLDDRQNGQSDDFSRGRRPSSSFNPYRELTEAERSAGEAGWIQSADVPDEVAGNFAKFRLSTGLTSKLRRMSIPYLFPVQTSAFNPIFDEEDVIVQARTGSGKTLSYVIPLVEKLLQSSPSSQVRGRRPRLLVMTPTRELARQVTEVIEQLSDDLSVACIYGGAPAGPQESQLRSGVDVVVGTPGRITDMMERGVLNLSDLRHVVLDEVDRMLDMGFAVPVDNILKDRYVPGSSEQNPQTLLFSATIPSWVQNTAKKYLRRDIRKLDLVGKGTVRTATTVEHLSICCPYHLRTAVIADTLKVYSGSHGRAIVFCETKREADQLALNRAIKTETHVLHGDIPQNKREMVLKGFRDGRYKVLIATDVAARGLDIPEVDLVIQCCPPKDVDSYIHRSGRTGRAGREGISVLIYKPSEKGDLQDVQRLAGIKFKPMAPPKQADVAVAAADDAIKSLEKVPAEAIESFKGLAEKLIEARGAVPALSAALAVVSGYTNEPVDDMEHYSQRGGGFKRYNDRDRTNRPRGGESWNSRGGSTPYRSSFNYSSTHKKSYKRGLNYDDDED